MGKYNNNIEIAGIDVRQKEPVRDFKFVQDFIENILDTCSYAEQNGIIVQIIESIKESRLIKLKELDSQHTELIAGINTFNNILENALKGRQP